MNRDRAAAAAANTAARAPKVPANRSAPPGRLLDVAAASDGVRAAPRRQRKLATDRKA